MDEYILLGEAHLENIFYHLLRHISDAKKRPEVYIELRRAMLLRSSIPALIHEFSPEVVYFESNEHGSKTILGKGLVDLAEEAKKDGAEAIFLDEGIRAYDILNKIAQVENPIFNSIVYPVFYLLNRIRENTWLEKMLDNGPGMALIGAAHLERIDALLSDAGHEVIQKNLWTETKKYAKKLRKTYGPDLKQISGYAWQIEDDR